MPRKMDSPPPARGHLYTTHTVQRCFAFLPCIACQRCQNYDKNNAMCVFCESRKPEGPGHHCDCGQKRRDIIAKFEERFRRNITDSTPLDAQIPLDSVNEQLHQEIRSEFNNADLGVKVIE